MDTNDDKATEPRIDVRDGDTVVLTAGEVGYMGYFDCTKGKTFDGRDMPSWPELPPNIKAAWQAAADTIRRTYNGVHSAGAQLLFDPETSLFSIIVEGVEVYAKLDPVGLRRTGRTGATPVGTTADGEPVFGGPQ